MTRCKPILPAVFLAFSHVPAHAAEGVVGANLAAMGGAAAANPDDNAPITVNPGAIALKERYDLHGHFRYGPDQLNQWGFSAVDGRTSNWLTLGLYYAGDRANPPLTPADLPGWTLPGEDPDNIKRHHDFTLAFAGHGWDRRLSAGFSGTFAIYNHDRHGAGSTGNVDVGVAARPVDGFTIGVAGRNLIPVNDLGELPLTVVGGMRVHGEAGALSADVDWRDIKADFPLTFAGGGELPIGEIPRLRAGYRYEGPIEQHRLTGGFGLVGASGSIDIGVQVPVGAGQPTLSGLAGLISIHLAAPKGDDPVGF